MAKQFLIIDGYNLMHAWGIARQRYGPGDLERCRRQFLNQLGNRLPDDERPQTTIVFDAGQDAPADGPAREQVHQMEVIFAVQDADADTRIERLIAGHSAPRQIRVVSSDRRLQQAARRRRGRFVSSEQFVTELERPRPASAPNSPDQRAKYSGELTEGEIAEWLEFFGETDDS